MTREARTDAQLVAAAAQGGQAAFAELFRRHRERAQRVAAAVAGNADDAADAGSEAFADVFRVVRSGRFPDGADFGAYVATAARRAALDQARRSARTTLRAELERGESHDARPSDRVVAVESAALVARAFAGLSSNLRAVLYFTEVLGMPVREAAAELGVTPNACAQRAVRARARLRQRYLQAHLAPSAAQGCRETVAVLGAYVAGGMAPRAKGKVDVHLASCETCRYRVAELRDLAGVLRRAAPDVGRIPRRTVAKPSAAPTTG